MKTILIADDDPSIRESFSDLLSSQYKVITTGSGNDAVVLLNTEQIDTVLCDFDMPRGNGLVVLDKANSINIPVVMISSVWDKQSIMAITNKKPFFFFDKIEKINVVLQKIEEAVEHRAKHENENIYKTLGEHSAKFIHDMTNPLTIIMGNAEKIRMHKNNPVMIEKSLDKIDQSVERITQMIHKTRMGEEPIKLDPTSMVKYLVEFKEDQEFSLKRNSTKLIIDIPQKKDFLVSLDKGSFSRVMANLIDNAIYEFNRNNQEDREIKITMMQTNSSHIELKIKDNGKGIPFAIRDKLFKEKVTSKPLGEGSGLGLGNCHDIVSEHKGQIYLTEGSGGAEFVITLPISSQSKH